MLAPTSRPAAAGEDDFAHARALFPRWRGAFRGPGRLSGGKQQMLAIGPPASVHPAEAACSDEPSLASPPQAVERNSTVANPARRPAANIHGEQMAPTRRSGSSGSGVTCGARRIVHEGASAGPASTIRGSRRLPGTRDSAGLRRASGIRFRASLRSLHVGAPRFVERQPRGSPSSSTMRKLICGSPPRPAMHSRCMAW